MKISVSVIDMCQKVVFDAYILSKIYSSLNYCMWCLQKHVTSKGLPWILFSIRLSAGLHAENVAGGGGSKQRKCSGAKMQPCINFSKARLQLTVSAL